MYMPTAMSTDSTKSHSKPLLVVIDMQQDFVTGSLGSEEAQRVVDRIARKIQSHAGLLAYTLDTHQSDYLQTSEGRHLPIEHCIKGSAGHALVPTLKPLLESACCFEKPSFGSVELASWIAANPDISQVELVGVCTDICVVSNALLIKAFRPELQVLVDGSCCAGTSIQAHQAALQTMRSCQIEVF